MDVLMDGLLVAATLFAGGYCWVLARRVRALKSLDSGLGGAIVNLTRQVELARGTLDEAQAAARHTRSDLGALIAQAESATSQLRLSLAAARLSTAERDDAPEAGPATAATPDPTPAPASPTPAPAEPAPASVGTAQAPAPTRLADIAGLFSDVGGPAPASQAPAAEPVATEAPLPKPRGLPPVVNPLRRREPIAPVRSEDELMDMLTSLAAAGGAR